MNDLLARLREKHLRDAESGLCAVCSVHPVVLGCVLDAAAGMPSGAVLIEATANQVNPFGGYSGMTPADFVSYLGRMARNADLPAERLLIGADHLGPHVWKRLPAAEAMEKAALLAHQCVAAGFDKIHLDTVQGCADDPGPQLDLEETARRAAQLCRAAEAAARDRAHRPPPLYVIGNEVPPPGGGLEEGSDIIVTDPDQLLNTLDAYQRAFTAAGVAAAWPRVMAVVVQPGVEFGDRRVVAFDKERAAALSAAHARLPGIITYEVHATDYQTPNALRRMVRDHFPLLKVGPCLTFALRAALYALAGLEAALGNDIRKPCRLPEVMEQLMVTHAVHWQSHYRGSPETLHFLRHHSYRDRIRYYWSYPEARQAVDRLLRNLARPIAPALLERHLDGVMPICQDNGAVFDPRGTLKAAVHAALEPYLKAV